MNRDSRPSDKICGGGGPCSGTGGKGNLLVEKVFTRINDPVAYCIDCFAGTVAEKGAQHMEQLRASSHLILWNSAVMIPLPVLADIIPVLPAVKILPGFADISGYSCPVS